MIGEKFELSVVITSPIRWFDEIKIKETAYPKNEYRTSIGRDYEWFISLEISPEERKELLTIMVNSNDDYYAQDWVLKKAKERGLCEKG